MHKDVERREMDENDLWRLVREMERAVKGGKDFDGVVSALLNESRSVYRTAMQRWHSTRDGILAEKAALSATIGTLETRVFNALAVLARHRRTWGRGGGAAHSVAALVAGWRLVAQASCAHVRSRHRALCHRQYVQRRKCFGALLSHRREASARTDAAERAGGRLAAARGLQLVQQCYSVWQQFAVEVRVGRDRRAGAVVFMCRRLAGQDMASAVDAWRGAARRRRRVGCGLSQLALKLQRSAVGLALRRWQEQAGAARRLVSAQRRVIARLVMRAAAVALSSWSEYVSDAIAGRAAEAAEEAARRQHQQHLAQQEQDAERLRLEEADRLKREHERAAAAAAAEEERWRRADEQQRERERVEAEEREAYRQRLVQRVCQRLRHALVSSALLTWQGNARARARTRELGAKVAARLRGRRGAAALWRWRAASALTRQRAAGLSKLVGRSRLLTLSSALGCWESVTSEGLALRDKDEARQGVEEERQRWEEERLGREREHAKEREEWQAARLRLEEEVDAQRQRVEEGGVQAHRDLERAEQLWSARLKEAQDRQRLRVVGGRLRRASIACLSSCLEQWCAAARRRVQRQAQDLHALALVRRRSHGRVLSEAFSTWLLAARSAVRSARLHARALVRSQSRRCHAALHAWGLLAKRQRRNREVVSKRSLLAGVRRRRRQASTISVWRRVCMRGHVTRLQRTMTVLKTSLLPCVQHARWWQPSRASRLGLMLRAWRADVLYTRHCAVIVEHMTARSRGRMLRAALAALLVAADEASMTRLQCMRADEAAREAERQREKEAQMRRSWDQQAERLCRELEEEKERASCAEEAAREKERALARAKMRQLQEASVSALLARQTHVWQERAFAQWLESFDLCARRRRVLQRATSRARRSCASAALHIWHSACEARQWGCAHALRRWTGLMRFDARRRRQKTRKPFEIWRSSVVEQMVERVQQAQTDRERACAEFEHQHLREREMVDMLEEQVSSVSTALAAAMDKVAAASENAVRLDRERDRAVARERRREEEKAAREAATQHKREAAVLRLVVKTRRQCLGRPLLAWNGFAIERRRVRSGVRKVLVRSCLGLVRWVLSVWQQSALRTRRRCQVLARCAAKTRKTLVSFHCSCWREVVLCGKRGREQDGWQALLERGERAERELHTLMEAQERQRSLLEQEAVARREREEEEEEKKKARETEMAMLKDAVNKYRQEGEQQHLRAQVLEKEIDESARAQERERSERDRERAETAHQAEQLSRLEDLLSAEQAARRARDEEEVRRRQETAAAWEAERERERAARERELASLRAEMERELKARDDKEAERERERAKERVREREREAERKMCPVAVAVKFDLDFDATLCDAVSAGKFEAEVRDELCALLGIQREGLQWLACERGSVVATVALLPQSQEPRLPGDLAAELVAAAAPEDGPLRAGKLGQHVKGVEVRGLVAGAVCQGVSAERKCSMGAKVEMEARMRRERREEEEARERARASDEASREEEQQRHRAEMAGLRDELDAERRERAAREEDSARLLVEMRAEREERDTEREGNKQLLAQVRRLESLIATEQEIARERERAEEERREESEREKAARALRMGELETQLHEAALAEVCACHCCVRWLRARTARVTSGKFRKNPPELTLLAVLKPYAIRPSPAEYWDFSRLSKF